MTQALLPIDGAWACLEAEPDALGQVVRTFDDSGRAWAEIQFRDGLRRAPVDQIRSGLQRGHYVQHIPLSLGREVLGAGRVVGIRRIADRDQALVQLERSGESRWLPFERLRRIMEPSLRYVRGEVASPDAAERLALRLMAEALRTWNDATGALDRLDVDPLPHQIQLVHRIMQSNTADWLIADDVGLGKTIELGLLLAALESRRGARRVLIITPAGLTRQWQDEMMSKFQRPYSIYGRDFWINEPWQWAQYDRVIASLDLMKPRTPDEEDDEGSHFSKLLQARDWDLVVFDEAHRLSRGDDGGQTLRYRLARALRDRTGAMVLLTGTPHQGDNGKFRSLLKLVRPELSDELDMLEFQPELAAEMVLRNRKIDVTYADGEFIFKGQTVQTASINPGPQVRAADQALVPYLRAGYAAAEKMQGNRGRAIGFVMTTYRKLASSSILALRTALRRRLERLSGQAEEGIVFDPDVEDEGEGDDLLAERNLGPTREEFFAGEIQRLRDLIGVCDAAMPHDGKVARLREFVRHIVGERKTKVIIFTEYRATQDYLAAAVEAELGAPPVLINGSQKLDEKLAAVEAFDGGVDVLISTEAGGEGLNLHRACHTLINYDLPWNPSRLVQRIGRIYRYGQKQRVVIVNLHTANSIDDDVLAYTLQRIQRIAQQMRAVSAEYDDRYEAEIVGELLDQIDLKETMDKAFFEKVERSHERIEEALERARRAREIQAEMMDQLERFDPEALQRLGAFTTGHLAAFVRRAAPYAGAAVEEISADGEDFTLRLDQGLRGRFEEFGRRHVVPCTTRRRDGGARHVLQLDFKNSFVLDLIERTRSPDFGAGYARVSQVDFGGDVLAAFTTRWQDETGDVSGEGLVVAVSDEDGRIRLDNTALQPFFAGPAKAGSPLDNRADPQERLEALRDRVEAAMATEASRYKHPNDLTLFGVAERADGI